AHSALFRSLGTTTARVDGTATYQTSPPTSDGRVPTDGLAPTDSAYAPTAPLPGAFTSLPALLPPLRRRRTAAPSLRPRRGGESSAARGEGLADDGPGDRAAHVPEHAGRHVSRVDDAAAVPEGQRAGRRDERTGGRGDGQIPASSDLSSD